MDKGFIDILQKLVSEQGKEALLNLVKCKAFLADYTKGEYKKESRLLLQALETGVQKEIITTQELEICKKQQARLLQDEYFLAAEIASDVVDTLVLFLRGETPKTLSQTPQIITQLSPSPTPIVQTPSPTPVSPTKKKHIKRNLIIMGIVLLLLSLLIPFVFVLKDYEIELERNEITITKYIGSASRVHIPSRILFLPITSIGDWAFQECTNLASVTISNSVTEIGWGAFKGCTSLTSVTIPDSITRIGTFAFDNCANLNITWYYNPALTAANFKYNLKTVIIPDSVTSIEEYVFSNCTSLTVINVDSGNTTYSSDDGVLYNKNKTTLIACPTGKTGTYTIPSTVFNIGERAFYSCARLTNVTIPNNVTSIGDSAFSHSGLTSISIPNSVTNMGGGTFSYCKKLTRVNIGNGVTGIDSTKGLWSSGAFQECTSLASVTISNSVTEIGWGAFKGCTSLTSVTIPNSVTIIGYSAFSKTGLREVTIPNNVISIEDYAFEDCTSLTRVTFQGIPWIYTNTSFPGDLGNKYISGGRGRYTRSYGSNTWWKQ